MCLVYKYILTRDNGLAVVQAYRVVLPSPDDNLNASNQTIAKTGRSYRNQRPYFLLLLHNLLHRMQKHTRQTHASLATHRLRSAVKTPLATSLFQLLASNVV